MFSYDHVNYSHYLSLYWCQMHELQVTRPSLYQKLDSGEFCVQRSAKAFRSIAVDQAIEQTVNRHSKTKGGIIGFSCQPGAVQQWIVIAHQRAEITESALDMAGLSSSSVVSSHKEAATSRLQKDEQAVQKVLWLCCHHGKILSQLMQTSP